MLPAAVIGAAVNRTAAGRNQINYEGEEEIMIKVGIIGSTGYAGGELVRLLLQREDVESVLAETERKNRPSQNVLRRCRFVLEHEGPTLWWRRKK